MSVPPPIESGVVADNRAIGVMKKRRIHEQRERQRMMIYDKAVEIQHAVKKDPAFPRYLHKVYTELQSVSLDLAKGGAINVARSLLEHA
eukprot:3193594-Alexandrium_andersonii.AAC.1